MAKFVTLHTYVVILFNGTLLMGMGEKKKTVVATKTVIFHFGDGFSEKHVQQKPN